MATNLETALKDFLTSPVYVLGGLFLGLAVGIVGTFLTIKYGMFRQLRCRCRSFCLIFGFVSKLPGLDVRYAGFGQSVENVTVSKVILWNAGRGTIQKSDILAKDNVCIRIDPQYEILEVAIIQQKNAKSGFTSTLSQDRKHATIKFEFINPSEGVVIQVVHTGTKSKDLSIEGTIKDAGPIKRTYGGQGDKGAHISQNVMALVCFGLGALMPILLFVLLYFQPKPDPELMRLPTLVRLGIALPLAAMPIGIMFFISRIGRLPRGFETYDADL